MVLVIAGAAVGVSVMGWFVSPHITELMKVARDCAATQYMLSRDSKKKLEKLAQDLQSIKDLLNPASTAFVNGHDRLGHDRLGHLWQLKDYIHEVEETLDLFQLEILMKTETKHHGMNSNDKRWLSRKLVKVLENLEQTRDKARQLHQVPESFILTRQETGQIPVKVKTSFFGYEHEYDHLVTMLRPQQDDNKVKVDGKTHRVIAIVGHAGMGKTELARQAYRDAGDQFGLCIWVHAYGKNTPSDLLKEIRRSVPVPGDRPVGEMNISSLQKELEKLVESKRCLLVLDDVWNHESGTKDEKRQAWRALESLMSFAKDGSWILMTTRAKICSVTFKVDACIILDGIKPKEMICLINNTAKLRTDGSIDNSDQKIQELIDKQVPKLKGSPLAAEEIGDELREETRSDERCNILHNIENYVDSVLQAHLFTYRHLPPRLQRCFEFCSIFPSNWRFEHEKLTKMWIAHGFVEEDARQGRSMEDVARGYFYSLVDRSLFQKEGGPGGKGTTYFVIHEQIHWMLRMASHQNCISISHTTCHTTAARSIPPTVRHLSVTSGCLGHLKGYSIPLGNLRTLLVRKDDQGGGNDPISATEYEDILQQFKGVRVLDLTETGITQLPKSIKELKHVRYLGLPSTISSNLCHQITRLMFLQTISVGKGDDANYRNKKRECITNISGIGRLLKLQESIEFQVMRGSEKEGHAVSELARMNSLRGTLSIKCLDAVAGKEEAMKARLENKSAIKVLKLEWGPPDPRRVNGGPADSDAVAVLEGLQPHRDIHELRITRHPGATSPSWLGVKMEKLTSLYLRNCRKLNALPVLGELPCLELLDVKELPCVERIDGGFCGAGTFPKLKKVVLDDMPKLMVWVHMPKLALPELREVSIVDCPRLSSLSGLDYCTGLLKRRIKGCPAISPETVPAAFSTGKSTCKFH